MLGLLCLGGIEVINNLIHLPLEGCHGVGKMFANNIDFHVSPCGKLSLTDVLYEFFIDLNK